MFKSLKPLSRTVNRYPLSSFVILGICLQVLLQLPTLTYPSVNFDEVMWINTALETGDKTFVRASIGQFPIMLMDYIGALKGYIFKPIFEIFGPNIYSLRLPMVVVTGIASGIVSAGIYKAGLRGFSLVLFLFLILNPALGLQSQFDLGPTILEYLARCTVLYLLLQFYESRDTKLLLMAVGISFLALWNKLSYIWFLNGIVATALLIFLLSKKNVPKHNREWETGKQTYRYQIKVIGTSVSVLYLFFVFLYTAFVTSGSQQSNPDAFITKVDFLISTFSGTSLFTWFWSPTVPQFIIEILKALGTFGFLASMSFSLCDVFKFPNKQLFFQRSSHSTMKLIGLAFSAISLLQILQILVTNEADKPWHSLTAWPTFLASSLLGWTRLADFSRGRKVFRTISAGALTVAVILTVAVRIEMAHSLPQAQRGTSSWSKIFNTNLNEKLFSYLKNQTTGSVYFLDWGFQTLAIFYDSGNAVRYSDVTQEFRDQRPSETTIDSYREGAIFVTHGVSSSAFVEAREFFSVEFQKVNGYACLIDKFYDENSVPIFEVWKKCN